MSKGSGGDSEPFSFAQTPQATVVELEAGRTIKEYDTALANYRAALEASPSETVAHWISETKTAELRVRKVRTGEGMTASEIRDVVERMHGLVAILQSASTEDRRRVYEAAQLSIHLRPGKKSETPRISGSGGRGPHNLSLWVPETRTWALTREDTRRS